MARLGVKKKSPRATELSQLKKELQRVRTWINAGQEVCRAAWGKDLGGEREVGKGSMFTFTLPINPHPFPLPEGEG